MRGGSAAVGGVVDIDGSAGQRVLDGQSALDLLDAHVATPNDDGVGLKSVADQRGGYVSVQHVDRGAGEAGLDIDGARAGSLVRDRHGTQTANAAIGLA